MRTVAGTCIAAGSGVTTGGDVVMEAITDFAVERRASANAKICPAKRARSGCVPVATDRSCAKSNVLFYS
jgi:hypothetical protein